MDYLIYISNLQLNNSMNKIILFSLLIILIVCNHPGHDELSQENAILLSDQLRASVNSIDSQLGELIGADDSGFQINPDSYSVGQLLDQVIQGDLKRIDTSRIKIRSLIQQAKSLNFFKKLALFTKATKALKKIKESGINIWEVFKKWKAFGIQDFSTLKSLKNINWQLLITNLERVRESDENGRRNNLQINNSNRLLQNFTLEWLILLIIIILFIIMMLI